VRQPLRWMLRGIAAWAAMMLAATTAQSRDQSATTAITSRPAAIAAAEPSSPDTQLPTAAAPVPMTSWGEPDLQGIWTDPNTTPFQRPAKYAGREFLTDAEITEQEKERAGDRFSAALASGDLLLRPLGLEGGEQDVSRDKGVFVSTKRTGRRTSLVVDPPDGRVPALTPEAQARSRAIRDFQLALMQATDTCRKLGGGATGACPDGPTGALSPRRGDPAPYYNPGRLNRADGPEDRSLAERCMAAGLPDVGGFRQISQSPGSVAIFYDTGQGQGWHRIIPIGASPHLPPHVRQWWGDSRGHWEGHTLVVDVTNFSAQTDYRGSRENLHLIERWTRTGPDALEYAVTIEDATVWTSPWTIKQGMTRQSDQANRVYKEPRCHEGNLGLLGIVANMRAAEKAFAEGRGPDPTTVDNATNQDLGEEADGVGGG
jgi:hypothetical protein